MSTQGKSSRRGQCGDVRLRGFSDRATFQEAIDWVDAYCRHSLPAEELNIASALGCVLAEPAIALIDVPAADCADIDGYALRSAETEGATDYNPLTFELGEPGHSLPLAGAAMVVSGTPLPDGADAIVPFDITQRQGATLEIFAAVAAGFGVERKGQQVRAGATLIEAARMLRSQDLAMLALAGVEKVRTVRRPRVRLVTIGLKTFAEPSCTGDADRLMLCNLIARDGGVVETICLGTGCRQAIGKAITAPGVDVVLVVGRTGTGSDDEAPLALAEVGEVAIHGVALRPGGSLALGAANGAPVLLLPGDPLGCFCAYELFAGRLIRILGGRAPEFPHVVREAKTGRKLVSAIGLVDFCRVRMVRGLVEPVCSPELGGLASCVRADGFVLVPAPLEGYAPDAWVKVHLY